MVRNSTASSAAGVPLAISSAQRDATAAASAGSSENEQTRGVGPGGRWPISFSRTRASAPLAAEITALASSTTCGVDR